MKQRIVTYWCYTVVTLYAIFLAIPKACIYALLWRRNEARRLEFHEWFCHWCRWAATHIPGVTFACSNPHGEHFEKPAMLIANHQSMLDIISIVSLTPRLVVMTNQWVWYFPLFHYVIRYLEYYPSTQGANEAYLRSVMERGYSILIFPEGTRSQDCKILKFKRGAFYLAQQLKADILPIYLNGCGKVMPKGQTLIYPGHIDIEIGERVPFDPNNEQSHGEQTRYWHKHYLEKFGSTQ